MRIGADCWAKSADTQENHRPSGFGLAAHAKRTMRRLGFAATSQLIASLLFVSTSLLVTAVATDASESAKAALSVYNRASFILESRDRPHSQAAANRTAEANVVSASPAEIKAGPKQYNFGDGEDYVGLCPSLVECSKLGGECINCAFNKSCIYGANVTVKCTPKKGVQCTGPLAFERHLTCQYCYQSDAWEHSCTKSLSCRVASNPRERFLANCTANSDVICLGNRTFQKYFLCNWTSGYKWSTALILSITLGGFGVDRFYLGHWQEGIGKLFSFGGLGVWTLLDVLLIAVGYLRPADGSLYI